MRTIRSVSRIPDPVVTSPAGRSGDAATFINACRTIAAELGYLRGEILKDYAQNELPSILNPWLSLDEQEELCSAVQIMERLSPFPHSVFPRFSAVSIIAWGLPRPADGDEEWDLDRLERIFRGAYDTLVRSPITLRAKTLCREMGQTPANDACPKSLLVRSIKCDTGSRTLNLLSALLQLACECTRLRMRIAPTDFCV